MCVLVIVEKLRVLLRSDEELHAKLMEDSIMNLHVVPAL